MARKEFIKVLEENMLLLDRLAGRLHRNPVSASDLPRQQMTVLVRLYTGGRARLKDIARREMVTAPNLCAAFRKLEREKLVSRIVDDNDRRNTWYQVTPKGEETAKKIIDFFRGEIAEMFAGIGTEDEEVLTQSMKKINNILKKMAGAESQNV